MHRGKISVAAKRDNISLSDSICAEDIGKFPDLNLAESLQRIPAVQIARDFTGEGTSVAVRGLGRDFTQITLNGAPVETASHGNIDSVSQGRGIDLRIARPFDNKGFHINYSAKAGYQESAGSGARAWESAGRSDGRQTASHGRQ